MAGTTKKKGGPPHADSVSAGRRTPGLNGGQEKVENVYRALMWSPEEAALRNTSYQHSSEAAVLWPAVRRG